MSGQLIEQGLPQIEEKGESQRSVDLRLPQFADTSSHFNELLARLMLIVMSSPTLYTLYRSVTSTLKTETPCDIALLIRVDHAQQEDLILAESGWDTHLPPLHFSPSDMALMKEAAFFSVPQNFLATPPPEPSLFNQIRATTGISVSILVEGEPYAILVLLNRSSHSAVASPPLGPDEIKLMLTVAEALSQRIYNETRLVALREARDAAILSNQSKTQFLARISHEIRTPMGGVIGMLDLLRSTQLNEKQAEYLAVAEQTAESMVGLINRFLDLAKIETGKILLEEVAFDLPQLLDQTAEIFRNRALQRNITFQSDISEKLPTYVLGDPARLRQIIVNLLGNSLKFTHQGHILFKTRIERLEEGRLRLIGEVTDTGIGISHEAQQKVFESFSQANESISRVYGGTGLGLSICRQLAEMMGGEIRVVHSALGEGTTMEFSIVLSLAEAPTELFIDPTSPDEPDTCSRRALIVGTDLLKSELPQWLREVGFALLPATTGLEALSLVKEMALPPCVVFVGDHLPGIHQYQLIDVLRKVLSPETTRLVAIKSDSLQSNSPQSDPLSSSEPPHSLPSSAMQLPLDKEKLFEALPRLRNALIELELSATLSEETLFNHKPTSLDSPPPAETPPAVEAEAESRTEKSSAKILIAEDNPVNRKVTLDTLAKLGYEAEVVENGAQAVERVQQQPFNLILMDCQMPVMDGYEATQRIREIESTDGQHTPIVAITAHAMEGDREKCLDAGMDDYLSKPIRMSLLKAMVEKWLSSDSESH